MRALFAGPWLFLLLFLTIGCSATTSDVVSNPPAASEPGKGTGELAASPSEQRIIVRSGNMSLLVDDVVGTRQRIAELAENFGGYVVSSKVSGEGEDISGSISIRVAEQKFGQAIDELRKLAVRVRTETRNSKDVTEEYVDLKARLSNAETTERQYVALFEKAKSVEEIIKVQEKLSQARRDVEQIKGRMQFLEQTSATALIEVELRTVSSASPLVRSGWDASEIFREAVRDFVGTVQALATIAIWLVVFSPFWGVVLGLVIWGTRRNKRPGQTPASGLVLTENLGAGANTNDSEPSKM